MRSEYLESMLQVSAVERFGTGVYLLNPKIIFPDGEWEAWFHASWLAGANRYPSFWDLMEAEYAAFLGLLSRP